MKVLDSDKDKIILEVADISEITEAEKNSFNWPASVPKLVVKLGGGERDEEKIIGARVFENCKIRIIYGAPKDGIGLSGGVNDFPELTVSKIADKTELVEFYLKTQKKHFNDVWAAETSGAPQLSPAVLAEKLSVENAICLEIKGVRVGFVALVDWVNWFGVPSSLVSWIWIDGELRPEVRKAVHQKIIRWLRERTAEKLSCVVDVFNVRSRRFFKKIGFIPECLIVSRKQLH
ncbi:MAG TPA: hypothetical protein DCW72_00665 [Elusimicrobia bacterium]|nr:MAG: hypothetical protein A2X29_04630 [Elusimicrobia bacterium GWA2_64_40]OGR65819.1 MAG: hypothetical protein A2X30_10170 [Elusimicrobia bacterium GWB2_63_16]HAN05588.1 hypothetical protein [Elusimicrobiota bacterium]HAU88785.1 hypothetical protein [Elusimicrobiota bacterium]